MVLRELLYSTDLLRAQTLHIHEMMEVIIIYENKNLMLIVFQIMTLYFKNFDDS